MLTGITHLRDRIDILLRFFNYLHYGSRPELPTKLNLSEEKTLLYLFHEEGCPMNDYSSKLGVERGSFTSVADNLERKELIKREIFATDKRKSALVLTEEGRKIAGIIDVFYTRRIEGKLSELSEEEALELDHALTIIASTFTKVYKRGE